MFPTTQERRTNFGNLYIKKTEFKADADFRCEVLAENDFNTAIQIKKVRVYCKLLVCFLEQSKQYKLTTLVCRTDIPRDGQPIILGKKSNFRASEQVNLTCTSPMSSPAARLMVSLNGNSLVGGQQNLYQRTYYSHYDNGLTSTSVNVQFPSNWLNGGRKNSKHNQFECTSSIVHRFNRTEGVRFEARTNAEGKSAYYLDSRSTKASLSGPLASSSAAAAAESNIIQTVQPSGGGKCCCFEGIANLFFCYPSQIDYHHASRMSRSVSRWARSSLCAASRHRTSPCPSCTGCWTGSRSSRNTSTMVRPPITSNTGT